MVHCKFQGFKTVFSYLGLLQARCSIPVWYKPFMQHGFSQTAVAKRQSYLNCSLTQLDNLPTLCSTQRQQLYKTDKLSSQTHQALYIFLRVCEIQQLIFLFVHQFQYDLAHEMPETSQKWHALSFSQGSLPTLWNKNISVRYQGKLTAHQVLSM